MVVVSFLAFDGRSQADITTGLIAHWTFDDGTGTDVTGNGNNGVVNGAVPAAGQVGGALEFDGVNDYVNVDGLDVTGSEITLTAWVNSDNLFNCSAGDCRIASKATGAGEQDHFIMISTTSSGGSKLRFRLKAGGSTQTLIASSGNIVTGQWMHVAATYDGANMRVFVDGAEVGSVAKTGTIATNPTVPFWIGNNPPTAISRPWDGKIDDVRLYNRALSPADIQELSGQIVPILTTINVIPPTITIPADSQFQFDAEGFDQFGDPFPVSPTWSFIDGSLIDQTGQFTAGSTDTVVAEQNGVIGTALVTIAGSGDPGPGPGLVVNTLVDEIDGNCADGDCSIRDAIALTSPGSSVTFAPAIFGGTINLTLSSGLLELNSGATVIDGADADMTIDGAVLVSSPDNALKGLTITGQVTINDDNNTLGGSLLSDRNTIKTIVIEDVDTGSLPIVEGNLIENNVIENVNVLSVSASNANISPNVLRSNYIGVAADGFTVLGSPGHGVDIESSSATHLIGNVISGHALDGINIFDGASHSTVIHGNKIGTDATGTFSVENGSGISASGWHTEIGGVISGEGNLVSGNRKSGVTLDGDGPQNVIGNYVGTDLAGLAAIPNLWGGIADGTTLSSVTPYVISSNLVSGNLRNGISAGFNGIPGSVIISGNKIGTDITGLAPLPNEDFAIRAVSFTTIVDNILANSGAFGMRVEEHNAIVNNVIVSNNGGGIYATGFGNTISGNQIHDNAGVGLRLNSSSLGADNFVLSNEIFSNAGNGVTLIGDGQGNRLSRNSIHSNNGLGIDINDDGVTLNDVEDGDVGMANYPVLTFAGSGNVKVEGTINALPNREYLIEVFESPACDQSGHGEGQRFVNSFTLTTDASGDAAFDVAFGIPPVTPGNFITTTATGIEGTSEFSACQVLELQSLQPLVVDTLLDELDGSCVDGDCSLRDALGLSAPGQTLTFAPAIHGGTIPLPSLLGLKILNIDGEGTIIDGVGANITLDGRVWLMSPNNVIKGLTVTEQLLIADGNNTVGGPDPADGNTIELLQLTGDISGTNTEGSLVENNVITNVNVSLLTGFGTSASPNVIRSNYVGIAADGFSPLGSITSGVFINSSVPTHLIDNVISGHALDGINIVAGSAADLLIHGNKIGTDATGAFAVPNGGNGISLSSSNVEIGGLNFGEGNLISGNAGAGITILNVGLNNLVSRNSIHSNGGLGIDINGDGVTPNDGFDADVGTPNFPDWFAAIYEPALEKLEITLDLATTPNQEFRIDIFESPTCDPSGHGEGQTFVLSHILTSDSFGGGILSDQFSAANLTVGNFLTAVATGPEGTSEFSACQVIEQKQTGTVVDTLADELDGSCGDGDCSLRDAVALTDSNPGPDLITFAPTLSGGTINLASQLDLLGGETTINGKGAGVTVAGTLFLNSDGNVIEGLTLPGLVWIAHSNNIIGGFTPFFGNTIGRLLLEDVNSEFTPPSVQWNLVQYNVITEVDVLNVNPGSGSVAPNRFLTNLIGVAADGITPLGNAGIGFHIHSSSNTHVVNNVISGHGGDGLHISGTATDKSLGTLLESNKIGTDATGTTAVPNGGDGIHADGIGTVIGGLNDPSQSNLISGNLGDGIELAGASAQFIYGNRIGTDLTGIMVIPNGGFGINDGTILNPLAQPYSISSNLVSGNLAGGIKGGTVSNVGDLTITNNTIGTDLSGMLSLPNGVFGIGIYAASPVVVDLNTVANNGGGGIVVDSISGVVTDNLVHDNGSGITILDFGIVKGNTIRDNGNFGIQVVGNGSIIGGVLPGEGNIVTGHTYGMALLDGDGNQVVGNQFTDNTLDGLSLDATSNNTFADNVISNNGQRGVTMSGPEFGRPAPAGNIFVRNTIEFNGWAGIDATLGVDNQIGTGDPADGNVFFNNSIGFGPAPFAGIVGDVAIRANSIRLHPGPGIAAANPPATVMLTSASAGSLMVDGTLTGTPNTSFIVEFFENQLCDASGFGEGEAFIDSTIVATDGAGNAGFTVSFPAFQATLGHFITATATSTTTSDFSNCVEITTAPASNLIGHWTFDDGTAIDSSGNGNHGVVNGALPIPGQVDGALDFDGINDHVDLGDLTVTGSEMTLAAWINPDNLANCAASDCRIAAKATGTGTQDHYLMLSTLNSGDGIKLRFRLKAGGVTQTLVASTGNLTNAEWAHVAATYDGTNMRLYLNGVEVGVAAHTGDIDVGSGIPLWIGGNPPSATARPWEGKIDDVRLYNKALSLAEIQAIAGV